MNTSIFIYDKGGAIYYRYPGISSFEYDAPVKIQDIFRIGVIAGKMSFDIVFAVIDENYDFVKFYYD